VPFEPPASGRWERVRRAVAGLAAGAARVTTPAASHIRENGYTATGLGFISAASFVHSIFTGLLVTGFLILVFEWKVSDEE
jgi:hypothetical protein